jgi:hypothetical protein
MEEEEDPPMLTNALSSDTPRQVTSTAPARETLLFT